MTMKHVTSTSKSSGFSVETSLRNSQFLSEFEVLLKLIDLQYLL